MGEGIDPSLEFAAPQFVDFTSFRDDIDPNADAWFDDHQDGHAMKKPLRRSLRLSGKFKPLSNLASKPFSQPQVPKTPKTPKARQALKPVTPSTHKQPNQHQNQQQQQQQPNLKRKHEAEPVGPRKLTVPKSPQLMTRLRAEVRPKVVLPTTEERELEEFLSIPKFKAQPLDRRIFESAGDFGVPRIQKANLTEPQPFSFETDRRLAARKATEETEQKKPQDFFSSLASSAPLVAEVRTVTEPEPFDLLTEERGAHYKRYFLTKKQEEEELLRQQAESFRARPADVLYKSPFQPARSTKPLTVIDANIVLHSDVRSKERSKYDAYLKKKEEEDELRELKRQQQQKEQEERETKLLRQQLVHHAKPMPSFQLEGPLYRASTKPLTVPVSPNFSTKRQKPMRN